MNTKAQVLEALDKLIEVSSPDAQLQLMQVYSFMESVPKREFSRVTLMLSVAPSLGTVRVRSREAYDTGTAAQIEHQRDRLAELLLKACRRVHEQTGLGTLITTA